ncbi:MAG: hypothetical protein CSA05_03615 [Bacteroidia bacterium]|nr:MAG: hypothetical protein CSA05_03615 [Bacteroidia bacterium]
MLNGWSTSSFCLDAKRDVLSSSTMWLLSEVEVLTDHAAEAKQKIKKNQCYLPTASTTLGCRA